MQKLLYANHNNVTVSSTKVKFFSTHVWRIIFLINSNKVYSNIVKKIYNSSTYIPYLFIGYEVFLYSGMKWLLRVINRWNVGFRFGVLV